MTRLYSWLRALLLCLCLCGTTAQASHLYGGELYYTWNSGNLYTVTMVIYGDCGASSVLSSLNTATPEVKVYNGSTLYRTLKLKILAGSGTEVTPICASSLGTTTCNGGTVPGIKKFSYADTVTMSPSSAWRLMFTGEFLNGTIAGRSSTITNIFTPGSTVTSLEATLNNLNAANSNPTFTTVPTPFFCIHIPQEYNQGAVDPNTGDSLVYELVTGLDGPTGGTVSYRGSYSAAAPMATATGSFTFSAATGQMTFKPNLAQISLVVCKVSEYRGGVLVGTSMREMNFIVLASCANRSPYGDISSVSGGTAVNATTVNVCQPGSVLSFKINPVDSDANNITVTYAGLPSGAVMTVTGSGTTKPSCSFSWNISGVATGTYYFYVTYQDDACPLSSKQTIAYTINIFPAPAFNYNLVSAATCTKKAVFRISPLNGNLPWRMMVYSGTSLISTRSGISGAVEDSLSPGTYRLRFLNNKDCSKDTMITFANPALPAVQSVSMQQPACYGGTDGRITISGTGGLSPYNYAVGTGAYGSSGTFSALKAGTYILRICDANLCIKDTTVVLGQPASIIATYAVSNPMCRDLSNGSVNLSASGGTAPYSYALGSAGTFAASPVFGGLKSGTYIFRIRDSKNCTVELSVTLVDSLRVTATVTATPAACFGNSDGSLSITAAGGTAAYTYSLNGTTYTPGSTMSGLSAGTYRVYVRDANGCTGDTSAEIVQPEALKALATLKDPLCFDSKDGSLSLDGSGGTAPYTYALNSGSYSSTRIFSGLDSGIYLLKLKDSRGCVKDTAVRLQRPAALTFTYKLESAATCTRKAIFRITPITGLLPWDMTVSSGTTAVHTITGISGSVSDSLLPGTYTLHLANGNGCFTDTLITLSAPARPNVQSLLPEMPSCNGGSDGRISLMGKDGLAPYTYAIGAGVFGASGVFSGLTAGTYTLSIRDANSCVKDTVITLAQPAPISVRVAVRRPMCKERTDGEVSLSGTGGTAPYTYAMGTTGTFVSSGVFGSLGAGAYTFRVKDKNNCIRDTLVSLTDSLSVNALAEVKSPNCFEGKDGSITLSASRGTAPYTYALGAGAWMPAGVFPGLGAGTYAVRVRDHYGCITEISVKVTQPGPLSLLPDMKMPSCEGFLDGVITINGSGGTSPYTYAINDGPFGSDPSFTGLRSGTYVLRLKDKNGCTRDTIVELAQPSTLSFTAALTSPLCHGGENGTALIAVSGGTPSYTYIAGDRAPQTVNLIEGLKAGKWVVQVKDANGCMATDTLALTEPDKLAFSDIALTHPTCEGYADGAIDVKGSGGVSPYMFRIDGGSFTDASNLRDVKEGGHTISIRDRNNCITDTLVTLKGYPHILLDSTQVTAASCFGKDDGSFILYASGGNPPLSYYLTQTGKRSDEASYDKLGARTYTVRVTDFRNCSKEFEVAVPQPDKLAIVLDAIHNDCTGFDTSGRLTAKISGGTAPYTYWWSTGSTDSVIYRLNNGWYGIRVSDSKQCSDSVSGEVYYDNCCTPAIPNAFTPNNDGDNDLFRILYKGDITLKEFIIYNRYGQQVFSTRDITQGWDGTFQGQKVELGVYYWYIRMICGNNKDREVSFKGDVTLLR